MPLPEYTQMVHRALVGLGSNQGDSVLQLEQAMVVLDAVAGIRVTGVSSLYFTAPVGGVEQPDYCNQAAVVETTLEPQPLLERLLSIEAEFGRQRTIHWGPRTLDLDLLFFDQVVMQTSTLALPHPRLHERGFVLAPLVELVPEWVHPLLGKTVLQMYQQWVATVGAPQQHIRRVASVCPLQTGSAD